ncbi:activating transcription factor 7-interacting protein 1-like [Mustela nigripes]|uniref:activating transcription factor 7-interacting protein 1-like n=1 Tax=Mustela nigripes TaxID=77151 RepID=UPI0028159652|nr:activating transcription factor 7-interacting protein 1-like [Mustela nigripes]
MRAPLLLKVWSDVPPWKQLLKVRILGSAASRELAPPPWSVFSRISSDSLLCRSYLQDKGHCSVPRTAAVLPLDLLFMATIPTHPFYPGHYPLLSQEQFPEKCHFLRRLSGRHSPPEVETNGKDSKPEEEEQVINEDERPSEKSEFSRRKRSKSEDMDNVQSKRRRYMEDEYEAEFQVKITAKGDINQKLQKVVQWLLEEKLCALQCAVFDKTLAELKTRVEKIECNKRHKTVITELQVRILI